MLQPMASVVLVFPTPHFPMVGMFLIECVSGKGALPSASLPNSCMKMSDVMSMLCIAGDRLQTSSQKRFYQTTLSPRLLLAMALQVACPVCLSAVAIDIVTCMARCKREPRARGAIATKPQKTP